MMDRVAILIPCYNESKTIGKVVKDWKTVLPDAAVYVYDNNSSDGTDEIARSAAAIVRYEHLQGKGNVVRRMFQEIDAECYILVDGDDTYPAEDGPEMADKVLNTGWIWLSEIDCHRHITLKTKDCFIISATLL